jgi:hypothetical protein
MAVNMLPVTAAIAVMFLLVSNIKKSAKGIG